jgi:hypothetical protein
MKKKFGYTAYVAAILILLGLIYAHNSVKYSRQVFKATEGRIYTCVDSVPRTDAAIIVLESPIEPSEWLNHQIEMVAKLYHAGKIDQIAITAQSDTIAYNSLTNSTPFHHLTFNELLTLHERLSDRREHDLNVMFRMLDTLAYKYKVPAHRLFLDPEPKRSNYAFYKLRQNFNELREKIKMDSNLLITPASDMRCRLYQASFYGFAAIGLTEDTLTATYSNLLTENNVCKLLIDSLVKTPVSIIPYGSPEYSATYERSVYEDTFGYLLYEYCNQRILGHEEKKQITGNFTGKGIDTLYVEEKLELKDRPWEEINYYLASNNPKIPRLLFSAYNYNEVNLVFEGDLDGNGTDEWGMLHWDANTQWANYHVFTLKNGEWKFLTDDSNLYMPLYFRTSGREAVEPGPKPGYVKINYAIDPLHIPQDRSAIDQDNYCYRDTIVQASYSNLNGCILVVK